MLTRQRTTVRRASWSRASTVTVRCVALDSPFTLHLTLYTINFGWCNPQVTTELLRRGAEVNRADKSVRLHCTAFAPAVP